MRTFTSAIRSGFIIIVAGSCLGLSWNWNMPSAMADTPAQPAASGDPARNMIPQAVKERFVSMASRIEAGPIQDLPVQSHGRVKPFDSFARESILFLTGKFGIWGLSPIQVYLGVIVSEDSKYLEIINIRDPELRTTLGFSKQDRYFSIYQLEHSRLEEIAKPMLAKQEQNERLVTPDEKKVIEAIQQVWFFNAIASGGHFIQSVNFNVEAKGEPHAAGPVVDAAEQYLRAVSSQNPYAAATQAQALNLAVRAQPMPELLRKGIDSVGTEVIYNHVRPFFWAGILYMLLAVLLLARFSSTFFTRKRVLSALALPLLLHAGGFITRVYITGFAPVTSMYGTMVWMAFGVVLFGSVLFYLYSNQLLYGVLLIGASCTLLLTESLPLILSPDMDPIVAVLRNNFWLTIHVLTISISYAAFTIAMLIGNFALIQSIIQGPEAEKKFKDTAHFAYRAIQLGVFLLTAGIILGGWWADYSWGRFWGWDPKETWALIADIGFLAILHARFAGWLRDFGLLASAPMAYLLVIMAWYGVNFILAAGLHSYGFSSGGATVVVSFVSTQLVLFAVAISLRRLRAVSGA